MRWVLYLFHARDHVLLLLLVPSFLSSNRNKRVRKRKKNKQQRNGCNVCVVCDVARVEKPLYIWIWCVRIVFKQHNSIMKAPSEICINIYINWMRHVLLLLLLLLLMCVYVLNDRTICYNACYSLAPENPSQCMCNKYFSSIAKPHWNRPGKLSKLSDRTRTNECNVDASYLMWDVESRGFG